MVNKKTFLDSLFVMLDLDVPEDELMTRLIKRGKDSGRADDNEETIKKRLLVYHSQTSPLIDWYKQEGQYQHIKGQGALEEIFADVLPSSVPFLISARNTSPVEMWLIPYFSTIFSLCVPFPEPGAPKITMFNICDLQFNCYLYYT